MYIVEIFVNNFTELAFNRGSISYMLIFETMGAITKLVNYRFMKASFDERTRRRRMRRSTRRCKQEVAKSEAVRDLLSGNTITCDRLD